MPLHPYEQRRDGARRVFTDQAGIACTKRKSPWGVRRVASRVSCILLRTACEADLHLDNSFNELIYFPAWPLPEIAMAVLCNCLVGAVP